MTALLQGTYIERFVEGAAAGRALRLDPSVRLPRAAPASGCGPLPSELQRLLSTLRERDEHMTGARQEPGVFLHVCPF